MNTLKINHSLSLLIDLEVKLYCDNISKLEEDKFSIVCIVNLSFLASN